VGGAAAGEKFDNEAAKAYQSNPWSYLAAMSSKIDALGASGGIDPDELAGAVVEHMGAELAGAVVDALGKRINAQT
jgi:hypothetical protein